MVAEKRVDDPALHRHIHRGPGRRRRGKRAGRKASRAAPQRRTGTDVSPGRGAAACVVVPGQETRRARAGGGFPQLQPGWAKVLEGKSTVNKLCGSAGKGGEALYLKCMHTFAQHELV